MRLVIQLTAAPSRVTVLAMIGDSTNALVEGKSGSEAEVRDSLMALDRDSMAASWPKTMVVRSRFRFLSALRAATVTLFGGMRAI